MFTTFNRSALGVTVAATMLMAAGGSALAAEQAAKLFTIVTAQDETVVALTAEDAALSAAPATISKALADRGSLTVWRYAVRKASDGEMEQAPLRKISVQAQGVLRIEPYRTPLRVVATPG